MEEKSQEIPEEVAEEKVEETAEEEAAEEEEEEAPVEEEEEEEVVDPKAEIEESCKPKCVKQLLALQVRGCLHVCVCLCVDRGEGCGVWY